MPVTMREAAQQALEALESADWYINQLELIVYSDDDTDTHKDRAKVQAAVTALRAALAEPEQEPIGSEWEPCVKLPVTVHVRAQRPGETHVSTREGITPVKPDDLIMRGVSGEEYPIGRDIFERTYQRGEAPPQRKPLTSKEIDALRQGAERLNFVTLREFRIIARAIERAHGIGGKE